MLDDDLPPPPKQREFTEKEILERRDRLFTTLIIFFSGVTLVHKFIVPSALKMLHVRVAQYAEVDLWFLLPLFLFFLLLTRFQSRATAAVAGANLGYGAAEVLLVGLGKYGGWLSFSHLLSSIPLSLVLLFWLYNLRSTQALWLWLSALLVMALVLWLNL